LTKHIQKIIIKIEEVEEELINQRFDHVLEAKEGRLK